MFNGKIYRKLRTAEEGISGQTNLEFRPLKKKKKSFTANFPRFFILLISNVHTLTVDMALTMPLVIWSCRMCFTTSNWAALCLGMIWSAIFFSSELNFLNRSSNSRDRSWKGQRTSPSSLQTRRWVIISVMQPSRRLRALQPAVCLLSQLRTRCAGWAWPGLHPRSLSSKTRPTGGNLSHTPPPTNPGINMHQNKQAALLRINKEIKLPLRS